MATTCGNFEGTFARTGTPRAIREIDLPAFRPCSARARKENGRLSVSALCIARSKHSASIPDNAFPSSSEIRARLTLRAASPTGSRLLSLYFKLIMRLCVFLPVPVYQDVGDVLLDNRNAENRRASLPRYYRLERKEVEIAMLPCPNRQSRANGSNKENSPMTKHIREETRDSPKFSGRIKAFPQRYRSRYCYVGCFGIHRLY